MRTSKKIVITQYTNGFTANDIVVPSNHSNRFSSLGAHIQDQVTKQLTEMDLDSSQFSKHPFEIEITIKSLKP